MRYYIICLLLVCTARLSAQVIPDEGVPEPSQLEEQLENITQNNEDETPEDDSYLQNLIHYLKEPLNLNYADRGLLQQLHLLSPIQISNLLAYRKIFGEFLSIYELQAVPGWDIPLIRKMRPYITVRRDVAIFSSLGSRLRNGDHTLLTRVTQILEKQEGYLRDPASGLSYYPGSSQKVLVRYKYRFKNLLQYGITAEKDAGEQFFKGGQPSGFDYYSAHFFVRDLGMVKALALGDFSVNLGQGLILWQSLSFGKGGDIMNIKRQADVLRPYNSAGEIEFNRGVGITLEKGSWEGTAFASYRKLDGSFSTDTLDRLEYISSLSLSGLHRTQSELAKKGIQGQFTVGGNFNYTTPRFHLGINAVHYDFEHDIQKQPLLYNKFALTGDRHSNFSVDYSYTYKNMHFFGEAAIDGNFNKAFVNGLAISAASRVDMAFLYRNISRSYQSLYSDAFTESTNPNNETGFYTGIAITPIAELRINAYADFFTFPWIKYRMDAPGYGHDYMVQLTYKPSKKAYFYIRYRSDNKTINFNPEEKPLEPVILRPKESLRGQFTVKLNSAFTFRSRTELVFFDKNSEVPENGFLLTADVIYKPMLSPLSGNVRLAFFETDSYNSRIYAYENDVRFSYTIPVIYGKGFRYYLNLNYDLTRNIELWARFAQTIYNDRQEISSGLNAIHGNTKSELKFQVMFSF